MPRWRTFQSEDGRRPPPPAPQPARGRPHSPATAAAAGHGRSSTGASRPGWRGTGGGRRAVAEAPGQQRRPTSGLAVEHGHRRLVPDPPAGVDQAPHQVHVLAHPEVGVEARDAEGRPSDHQGGGGHVAHRPVRAHLARLRSQVQGRAGVGEPGQQRTDRSGRLSPAGAVGSDPGGHGADGRDRRTARPGRPSQPVGAPCSRCPRRPPARCRRPSSAWLRAAAGPAVDGSPDQPGPVPPADPGHRVRVVGGIVDHHHRHRRSRASRGSGRARRRGRDGHHHGHAPAPTGPSPVGRRAVGGGPCRRPPGGRPAAGRPRRRVRRPAGRRGRPRPSGLRVISRRDGRRPGRCRPGRRGPTGRGPARTPSGSGRHSERPPSTGMTAPVSGAAVRPGQPHQRRRHLLGGRAGARWAAGRRRTGCRPGRRAGRSRPAWPWPSSRG